jgi:hypothetical protein
MNKRRLLLLLIILGVLGASTWFIASNDLIGKVFNDDDPDRSPTGNEISREEYLLRRNEHLDMLRGYDTAQQESRTNSIREMERGERELISRGEQPQTAWVPLGPSPIPINGSTTYSGRVSAIAVHPTNPEIVYLGTAQGGLYRSPNGGTTWTPLMDSALTLAIGAIAISPSDPTTIYVGTGESTLCNSGCFIGVGVYRITNADTNPVLSDALNKNVANADVFTGRAISEILVHPTDPNTIFVGTTSGIAGIGASTTGLTLPFLGVYRSTNAMSANPTFQLLDIGISERSVTDLVMEPDNPNHIYAGVLGDATTGGGGVYATSNALGSTPTWTQVLATALTGRNSRVELAAAKPNGVPYVYAASGQGNGTIYVSPDAGPFSQVSNNAFCNPQCFYDIAIAVDPTNASKVYLGGSPSLPFGRSTNGGASFANSSSGLHVDSQVITIAPSNPNIVYFGSDGGVWRTTNAAATSISWTSLNNSTLSATQFMSLAIHPVDRNYSLGGTQDNGTEFHAPDGMQWIQSDGGDGGFAVIDQTSPDTTNVVAYHTYYNSSGSQIGFARALSTVSPGDPNWNEFLGCGGTSNGINCADATLFYAPMAGGPNATGSTGNTLYFGTDHLYRSINQGTTMSPVSQSLPARISAIAISPQNDSIRLIGLTTGVVFLSTMPDASTMISVTGAIPSRYVGRIAIDPSDSNIAYVCLNGFGLSAGQHVWKTTNLLSGIGSVTWTPAGAGIPDTPVDSFAIDPANTNTLFAGTDIGVFRSSDGGANWIPFSNGLPRVAVFGMAIQNTHRILRISTHGRGIWDYDLTAVDPSPTPTSSNTATPTETQTPFPEYDLTISQSAAPNPVIVFQPLTYTLIVSNVPSALGGNACPNVRFGYPTGTQFSFSGASGTSGYNAVPDVGGVTFTGGCVSSSNGMTGTATLTVRISFSSFASGTLTSLGSNVVVDPENLWHESDETNNTAQTIQTTVINEPTSTPTWTPMFTPTNTATPTSTATATSTFTTTPSPAPTYRLSISQSDAPDPVHVGQDLTYTLLVFNEPGTPHGGGDACPLVRFGYPSGVPFVFASTTGTNGYHSTTDPGGVTFSGGCISSQGGTTRFATLTVHLRPLAAGTLTSLGMNVVVDPGSNWPTAQTVTTTVLPSPQADFDGDGKTDLSVFRPSDGNWYLDRSTQGFTSVNWGLSTDIPTPGDFDGDGKTDIAVFRPSNGFWYRINSGNGAFVAFNFGLAGDIPQARDFDGDGKTDIAVFRPSDGNWYWQRSSDGQFGGFHWGQNGDLPVAGDYDGNGTCDLAVFRPSTGYWYGHGITGPGTVFGFFTHFGLGTDMPVPADYDHDGKDDIAVFRPSTGFWYLLRSSDGGFGAENFGLNGDIPVPGDYDGDGKADIAVYRSGIWYIDRSTAGFAAFSYGLSTDIPIPKRYIP